MTRCGVKKAILAGLLALIFDVSVSAVPNINSITDNSPVVKYGKFEATYGLGNAYTNPYDPAVIDVNVMFA